jgi:sugar/nucleoside kinase (ribokinase family)
LPVGEIAKTTRFNGEQDGLVKKKFDLLGLGCAAVDDLLYVPSYPPADSKARVAKWARQCGGLTGNALVAAARLGARCAYAGRLGNDEWSSHIAKNFLSEGVDISHAPRLADAGVIHSTIIIAQETGSRNIFYEVHGEVGADPFLPADDVIGETKVLFIDHYGMPGNLRAMKCARSYGVPVVADFEDEAVPCFKEALDAVDHLVLSEEFACPLTRQAKAADAAQALWRPTRAVVIVTCGRNGCWSVDAESGEKPRHHPAFPVTAVNTSGCGDVFHGAYAFRLGCGDSLDERIRFASAAAAVKARQPEMPRLKDVEVLLAGDYGK